MLIVVIILGCVLSSSLQVEDVAAAIESIVYYQQPVFKLVNLFNALDNFHDFAGLRGRPNPGEPFWDFTIPRSFHVLLYLATPATITVVATWGIWELI